MNIDIGTIITGLGVVAAFFGAWWQIHKFRAEKEETKINTFRSSLLDLQGKLRNFVSRIGKLEVDWMDIAIAGKNEFRNYLHDIKSKTDLIKSLENEVSISSNISRVLKTGICKSKIRNKSLDKVNELMELLFRHDVDMPLTMEIIRDSLFFISWAIIISIDSAPYDNFFEKNTFCNYLQNLETESIDVVYRDITKTLFENISDSFFRTGNQTISAASTIIYILTQHILFGLKNSKKLMELQKWDKIQFFNKKSTQDIFEELVIDWSNLKSQLTDREYLLGCVEIRHIITNIAPWFYPEDYDNWKMVLIESYPEVMNVAL